MRSSVLVVLSILGLAIALPVQPRNISLLEQRDGGDALGIKRAEHAEIGFKRAVQLVPGHDYKREEELKRTPTGTNDQKRGDVVEKYKRGNQSIPDHDYKREDDLIPGPDYKREEGLIPGHDYKREEDVVPDHDYKREDGLIPGHDYKRADNLIPGHDYKRQNENDFPDHDY